jgi:hypothetical protein
MSAEKENIFRTLREEELIVPFWGCRFGLHKWTKWREPEKIDEGIYTFYIQQRRCSSCNKASRTVFKPLRR